MTENKHVKIAFEMEQDEDGWPPATVETLWAIDLGNGQYKIKNIPFFAPLLSCDDIVSVERKYDDMLYFKEKIKNSNNSTIRIIFYDKESINSVYQQLQKFGCSIEGGSDYKHLTAVDIPGNVKFKEVTNYLTKQEKKEILAFEESCISAHHKNQNQGGHGL